jgi:hypothetical protein
MRSLWLLALVAACTESPTVIVVTVEAQPALRPAARLAVTITNAGASVESELILPAGTQFPQTFTVTPTGRMGQLAVGVVAEDAGGLSIGRGFSTVTIAAHDEAQVVIRLAPDDFVVNHAVADNQWLTLLEEHQGRQAAVLDDGTFFFIWENSCPLNRCDMIARRFSPETIPLLNQTSMNDDDFIVNQSSDYAESPSIAAAGDRVLAAWLVADNIGSPRDVKITLLDGDGRHLRTDLRLTDDAEQDDSPTAVARADGTFLVVWEHELEATGKGQARGFLLTDAGAPAVNPITGTAAAFLLSSDPTRDDRQPHAVPLTGGGFVAAWVRRDTIGATVRARIFDPAGLPIAPDLLLSSPEIESSEEVHLAALPDGGFVAGWQARTVDDAVFGTTPLVVRRFSATGAPSGPEEILAAESFDIDASPVLAVSGETIGAAWADCDEGGDGDGCGVWLRVLDLSLAPSGPPVQVNTTTANDQRTPSLQPLGTGFLVGWTDGSMAPPDTAATAVRARVVQP